MQLKLFLVSNYNLSFLGFKFLIFILSNSLIQRMDLQFILNTDNFINKFCFSDMEIELGSYCPIQYWGP